MAKIQRSNYLPYIQHHLDTQGNTDGLILDIKCGICNERTLDISGSARDLTSSSLPPTKHLEAHRHLPRYLEHGLERTVALACGHVFGDRCIREIQSKETGDLICPSCGYHVAYKCGHAIRPALIPVDGHELVRDKFPLTISEGAEDPNNCLSCRWKLIRSNIRYALADECIFCRQMEAVHMLVDKATHRAHRNEHINTGLRSTLEDIVFLVWPEFKTRETTSSAAKALDDSDRHQAHVSLLDAMIRSEMLEETLWYRTRADKTMQLTKEQLKSHVQGMASIEDSVFELLMSSTREQRRMW